jgi:predicted component of type VI protein secretion system
MLKSEVRRLLKQQPNEAEQALKRRQALRKEINNLTNAIAGIGLSNSLKQRLQEAELDLSELGIPAPTPDFIPGLLDKYRGAINDLRNVPHARNALADLLGEVPLSYDGIGLVAELGGVYSGILARVASEIW